MNRTSAWVSALVVLNVLWAASYTVMKVASGSLNPLAIVLWRMVLGAAVMGAVGLMRSSSFNVVLRDLPRLIAVGVLTAASHSFVVAGIRFSQAVDASLLYVIEPLWGIALATAVLKESFTRWMAAGLMLVMTGAIMLSLKAQGDAGRGFITGGAAWGNALIIAGLICEGSFSVAVKPLIHRYSAVVILTFVFGISAAVLIGPTLVVAPRVVPASIGEWSQIAYLAFVCGALGYCGWIRIMRHVPVNVMYFSIFIQPVVGAAIAWLVLGETITVAMLLAGILLMAGFTMAVKDMLFRAPRAIPVDAPLIEVAP